MTEDKIVGCHHRLNGHESEQTPGITEGQGSQHVVIHGVAESGTIWQLNSNKGPYVLFLLILMNLSGPFNLPSGGFIAASPLISNCSTCWNSEKVREAGVFRQRRTKRLLCPGGPQGPAWHHILDTHHDAWHSVSMQYMLVE